MNPELWNVNAGRRFAPVTLFGVSVGLVAFACVCNSITLLQVKNRLKVIETRQSPPPQQLQPQQSTSPTVSDTLGGVADTATPAGPTLDARHPERRL